MSGPNTPDPALANAAAAFGKQLLALDEALAVQTFNASSSDGTIAAEASAAGDLTSLTISAARLTPAAGSDLPAALIPVLNTAIAKGQAKASSDLASLAASFSLPGLPAQPPVLPDIPGFAEALTSFQHQMRALEAAAATAPYVGSAADGKVEVTVNGLLNVTAITLDPSLFSSADAPATAGFIQQAVNLALRTARHDDACQETDAAAAAVARGVVRVLTLTAIVRDFRDTHPDFQPAISGLVPGLVRRRLGRGRKPIFVADPKRPGRGSITSAATFQQWFTDVPRVNRALRLPLELRETAPGSGIFAFESSAFFPIDGQLLGNQGRAHNYHFTLELHTTFRYQGGEVLQFTGDDDLWVFINQRLVVDLGGVHASVTRSIELDTLGLTRGQTYAFDLFFAERRTGGSRLRLQIGRAGDT